MATLAWRDPVQAPEDSPLQLNLGLVIDAACQRCLVSSRYCSDAMLCELHSRPARSILALDKRNGVLVLIRTCMLGGELDRGRRVDCRNSTRSACEIPLTYGLEAGELSAWMAWQIIRLKWLRMYMPIALLECVSRIRFGHSPAVALVSGANRAAPHKL